MFRKEWLCQRKSCGKRQNDAKLVGASVEHKKVEERKVKRRNERIVSRFQIWKFQIEIIWKQRLFLKLLDK